MNADISSDEPARDACNDEPLQCMIDVDTSSFPPAEQFDLFRSWYTGIADIELMQREARSFPVHQKVWNLGKLTLLHLKTPEYRYGWRHLSNPAIDDWSLLLALPQFPSSEGNLGFSDFSVQSFADPFEYVTEKNDFLVLFMPRNLDFIQSFKIEIRENAKTFLADYLLLLHRSLSDLRGADVPNVAAASTSLLAACLTKSRDNSVEAQRPIDAVIMSRASKIIAKQLTNPELASNLLCRELGLSRSGLYRIFEPVGGVSTYIRRERLRKTRMALANSSDRRPISTIAEQFGFLDPSTYSRMFKKEFGVSPREAREEGELTTTFTLSADPTDRTHTASDLLLGNWQMQEQSQANNRQRV